MVASLAHRLGQLLTHPLFHFFPHTSGVLPVRLLLILIEDVLHMLTVCSLAAGTAWYNTGERLIVSNETWWVDWTLPDGSNFHGGWKAGFPAIAMRPRNGRVVLRYWLAGQGYAKTEVDQEWLIKHSFDYVVAPTGATGAVKPAKRGSL